MKPAWMFALALATAFSSSAAAAAAAPASAAPAPANRFAAAPAPAERFEIKGMLVERHGGGAGPALILIPGLATGGWVWQETVREFAPGRAVYVVTLPGFDGRPALAGDPFDAAKAALTELIASRKLARPVLVGHSLGGSLSIALAADMAGKIGGVISIDGLPVMPRSEDTPPEQRAAMAETMRKRIEAAPASAFPAQQRQYMRSIGVVDMGKADEMAQLTARSDPGAVAAWIGAVLARDLRPGLARIDAPVLVIAPYYAPDAAALGGISAAEKVAYYRELMSGTARLQVEPIDNARHFAMIDQPQATNALLRQFLKNL